MDVLTSVQNPRIKQLVALRESRQRKKTGLTRIDGGRELLRALQAGLAPETVFVREGLEASGELAQALQLCQERGHELQPVSEIVYGKIRYGDRDEGICASLAWAPAEIDALPIPDEAFWLVVEGVEKPGNLGALLRTADAAGVDAVILADPACDPSNPNVVRASMGTLFTQPVVRTTTTTAIGFLRRHDAAVVTLRPQAERPWHGARLRAGRVAIVSGAEDRGLTPAWQQAATEDVRLPMAGFADSLNLAAATAILLYEVVRQRGAQSMAK
jgi:TrmH family RNA methyltransferase